MAMKRIVILISGRGSNMKAVLDARLQATVAAVISNTPAASGLQIARAAGIDTKVIDHHLYTDRAKFDHCLAETVATYHPDLIVLAGFMRILSKEFIQRFSGKIMNIHPSLLPAFPGLNTHRRAINEGAKLHGCTVHFVTPELDRGPIIIQAAVPVLPDDNEQTLASRVLEQEHAIYAQAIRWFLENKLAVVGNTVKVTSDCRYFGALVSPQP
jgi:phosphoribosylglycinamide formyltransferase-1